MNYFIHKCCGFKKRLYVYINKQTNTYKMERAIKIENGKYQITINDETFIITKGGNLNTGWWVRNSDNKILGRGKSKFNCEVFLNYKNPAYLTGDVQYFRYI